MLAAIALAAGLDGSLSEERPADTFVIGYALLLAVLVALFVRAHRRFPQARALTGRYAVGAALWLASLGFAPAVRPWIWAGAMLVLLVTPVIAVRAVEDEPYDTSHIPERYGLFTLIVLGESIVFTVEGSRPEPTWRRHSPRSSASCSPPACGGSTSGA
jgi:low temperature requirement protein LtrA